MSKNTVGKFYEVSKGAIHHVARHGNRAAPALAYLALKCGQQRNNTNVTSWGAKALVKVLGISMPKARKLMNELRGIAWGGEFQQTALIDAHAWNRHCEEAIPDFMDDDERGLVSLGHPGAGQGSNKVMPPCGDDFIYLPNSLTQKSPEKKYTPLGQLYHLPNKETRLHATLLLLGLYEHLDMAQFGGADPTETVYIPWRYEGESWHVSDASLELGYLDESGGLHYWVVDFRADDDREWYESMTRTQWSFIESITGETADDGEAPKFWKAYFELERLGLCFHAAMVFDADPRHDPDAEVLYPFWIFNPAERERLNDRGHMEGGLALLVAKKAQRKDIGDLNEAMYMIHTAAYPEGVLQESPTGWFIVAAPNPEARVMGILRPRFIPNTLDGQAGWATLRDKAEAWTRELTKK